MQRMGMVIGIAPERIPEYRTLHEAVWPAVLARADPETQRWWTFTDPCQQALATRAAGEHRAATEPVFHID